MTSLLARREFETHIPPAWFITEDVQEDGDFMGVPIEREKLFEVDVRTMRVRRVLSWQGVLVC